METPPPWKQIFTHRKKHMTGGDLPLLNIKSNSKNVAFSSSPSRIVTLTSADFALTADI
jgi:hypothetical protein